MADKVSIIVALVIKAETPTAAASSAASLVDAFNANPSAFALVNQYAQSIATISSIAYVAMQASPVAFINVATNTTAGATVFLKIIADVNDGKRVEPSDVYSLISNVAAVTATLTIMATGLGGLTAVAVAVLASAGSFFSSTVVQNTYNDLVKPLWNKYYENQPSASYVDHIVSPQLTLASQQEFMSNNNGARLVCKWDPATNHSWCDTVTSQDYGGGSDIGGGNWGGGESEPPDGNVIIDPIIPADEYQNDEYN
jgi:hypothetical protein